jgi:hypothetical protein
MPTKGVTPNEMRDAVLAAGSPHAAGTMAEMVDAYNAAQTSHV